RLRGNDGGAVSVFSDKFLKLKISSFPQKQKTKIRNLKFVIPAQAGIQCVEFQLFRINFETLIPSFPRKWESSSFGFTCFKFRVTSTSSFPRRRESSALSFSYLE
ncbi:hypothetical protein M5007_10965, partial [Neisseria meningitidis]|nr:hypothetical protein [Neisseria meningitidis]